MANVILNVAVKPSCIGLGIPDLSYDGQLMVSSNRIPSFIHKLEISFLPNSC